MSHAQGQPDFDLDEDLFDFAGVKREAEPAAGEEDLEQIFASFRDEPPEEELLAVPSASASADAAATAAPAPEPARPEAPARAGRAPAAARTQVAAPPAPPAPLPTPRAARFSRSVVAIAGAVTLLNLALAVVVLRRRPSEHDVRAVTSESGAPHDHDSHDGDAHAAPPRASEASLPEPESVATAHSHPALDAAREEISHGEYAAARQRVYGLLSIIDRLEDPRRSALEADCQFLIAQSLHLEALARMGGPR